MSDRIKGVVVAFEKEMHEDDANRIVRAIMQLRGVAAVGLSVDNSDDFINRARVRSELSDKLWSVLHTKEPTQ
jgi:hypothetical protein